MARGSGWWLLVVMVVGCGRVDSSSGPEDSVGGEPGTAGAPEAGEGGVGGVWSEAMGGAGAAAEPEPVGGSGDHGVSEGGANGGQGGEVPEAGAGGMPALDECAGSTDLVLEAPLATTTLTIVAPPSVRLGQGYSSEQPGEGEPLSEGCVTGLETNAYLALGMGGLQVIGGGTETLGTLDTEPPRGSWVLPSDELSSLIARLDAERDRSLYGHDDATISLWSYYMLNERRSSASPCGETFVRTARPSRSMSVTFKLVFSSGDERDRFKRCFSPSNTDVLALPDPTAASRFLVADRAAVEIHVLRAAGRYDTTRQLLDDTRCSAANLPACADTLAALQEELDALVLDTPAATRPLAEVTPDWGVFDISLGSYALLPD